jgi:hypothetical protein
MAWRMSSYLPVPILGIKRPAFEGKCATGCATFGKVGNGTCESLGVRFPGATDAGYSEFGLAMGVARYRRYTKSCP